jgi:two-component system sensor histidine kinase KdpD
LLAVAVATGVRQPGLGLAPNTDLVFLTAIVVIAVRFGLWPSLLASVVSALCYNFFFTEPYYTFAIADPRNVIAVLFFAIVAVVVSNVAARARTVAVTAMARARATESLYAFSRKLSGAGTLDDVLWASAYQAALMLKIRVVLLMPDNGSLAVKTGYPPEDILDEADLAAAKWAWTNDRPAGVAPTRRQRQRLFLPCAPAAVSWARRTINHAGSASHPDQRRLLDADRPAVAIERVHLVDDLDQANAGRGRPPARRAANIHFA